MGRSRYCICDNKAPHFITCTVVSWMPLFTRPQSVEIVLNAIHIGKNIMAAKLTGMSFWKTISNMIIQTENLSEELPRFKSFTARKLIDYLEACNAVRLLKQMAYFRKEHKLDRDYQCWGEGSHPQLIDSEEVLRQKLDYTHQNPVKRGYVDDSVHWRYSIARNYAGLPGLIPIFTGW